jgi:exodeoxyribonuclease VII large subunit
LVDARRRYEALEAHLTQLSPLAVLSRGYAIVLDGKDQVIRAATETHVGEALQIRLHAGSIAATVTDTHEDEPS